jgi:hypothetical protein
LPTATFAITDTLWEFNFATAEGNALIDLCLNNVPLSVDEAHPRGAPALRAGSVGEARCAKQR